MARSALFSSSVLSSAASGHRLPTLQVTLAFVRVCGGDPEYWERRWHQVSGHGAVVHAGARAQPARHSLPRPAQLPLRPRGFVGRVAEMCRFTSGQSAVPAVISGPVGVGKSEFALRYAHGIAERMTDGQLYADFGAARLEDHGVGVVLDGFVRALGVEAAHLPAEPQQLAGLYRSLLAERALVVLLDNVTDERQVRPLLVETSRSVTVVVSRTPLYGLRDVRRFELGALSRADSVAMLRATIPAGPGDDDRARDTLAELCGDLPLALDIAARKLTARPGLSIGDVVRRIAEPRSRLNWLQLGDQSVRGSLAQAYLRLSERARDHARYLARLPAGEPVASGGSVAEDDLLEELTEGGFLRRGDAPDEYRFDPLTRAFVADQTHGSAPPQPRDLCQFNGRGVVRMLSAARS